MDNLILVMIFLQKKIVERGIHAQKKKKTMNPTSTDTKEKYSACKCIMYSWKSDWKFYLNV